MSVVQEAFELPVFIERADIDQLGHVNNVVYLRWVQDVAVAHWEARAPARDKPRLRWVVLRHEIDYLKSAVPGAAIVARTLGGIVSRIRFERHTELIRWRDREALAKARTLWCPVDVRTGKPVAVSAEVRARFSVPARLSVPEEKHAGGEGCW